MATSLNQRRLEKLAYQLAHLADRLAVLAKKQEKQGHIKMSSKHTKILAKRIKKAVDKGMKKRPKKTGRKVIGTVVTYKGVQAKILEFNGDQAILRQRGKKIKIFKGYAYTLARKSA